MKTTITEQENAVVATLDGRLDTAASSQTETELQALLDANKDIILDCTKMEYISSSGLRIFLSILKKAKPSGKHVYIKGLNNDVRNVFNITGFISLFEYM